MSGNIAFMSAKLKTLFFLENRKPYTFCTLGSCCFMSVVPSEGIVDVGKGVEGREMNHSTPGFGISSGTDGHFETPKLSNWKLWGQGGMQPPLLRHPGLKCLDRGRGVEGREEGWTIPPQNLGISLSIYENFGTPKLSNRKLLGPVQPLLRHLVLTLWGRIHREDLCTKTCESQTYEAYVAQSVFTKGKVHKCIV